MVMNSTQTRPHIAMLQSPGIGHLIPLTALARRLALDHSLSVTLLIPTLGPPPSVQLTILANLPKHVNYITLHPVDPQKIPVGTSGEGALSLVILHSLPHIREAFESNQFDSLVVDIFGTDAFDVAKDFGVPSYVFYLGNALTLSLFWHIPELDETIECDFKDLGGPLRLPGCCPIEERDLMDSVKEKKSDSYKWILHHTKRYRLAKGIIVNSFKGLEPGPIKAMQEPDKPPVYPIGPLIQSIPDEPSDCLRWLDRQPDRSVLYISFGSGGTLNHDQFMELAHGLELSQQRFIWVVKSPNEVPFADYFTGKSPSNPLDFLPDGFLDRTNGMGLAIPSWAPQGQILRHASICGFLTHCGWNSVLEGIVCGVPFIVWPLFADQKMNAATLTDDLKIGLRPKAKENGIVERGEIANIVKRLMKNGEGCNPITDRMREMKNLTTKALGDDSEATETLTKLANSLKSHEMI